MQTNEQEGEQCHRDMKKKINIIQWKKTKCMQLQTMMCMQGKITGKWNKKDTQNQKRINPLEQKLLCKFRDDILKETWSLSKWVLYIKHNRRG